MIDKELNQILLRNIKDSLYKIQDTETLKIIARMLARLVGH